MTRSPIAPPEFARIVAAITGDPPPADADLAVLSDDPAVQACVAELDAIWHLAGTLTGASSDR